MTTNGDSGDTVTDPLAGTVDKNPLNTVGSSAIGGALEALRQAAEEVNDLLAGDPQQGAVEPQATAD